MRRLTTFLLMIPLLGAVAVSAVAQAPTTTEELLSGMVTEEVEPGVFRVVNDGVRDLGGPGEAYPGAFVHAAPDGTIWLSGTGSEDGLLRLGGEATYRDPGRDPMDYYAEWRVGPDGALWTNKGLTLHTFRDGSWSWQRLPRSVGAIVDFDVAPDGAVWVAGLASLHRLDPDGSLTSAEGLGEMLSGDLEIDLVEVGAGGVVWITGLERDLGTAAGEDAGSRRLLRYDGDGWMLVGDPEGVSWAQRASLAATPSGELWIATELGDRLGLARLDDAGWTGYGKADGVTGWGQHFGVWFFSQVLEVAPDGAAWVNGAGDGMVAVWPGSMPAPGKHISMIASSMTTRSVPRARSGCAPAAEPTSSGSTSTSSLPRP